MPPVSSWARCSWRLASCQFCRASRSASAAPIVAHGGTPLGFLPVPVGLRAILRGALLVANGVGIGRLDDDLTHGGRGEAVTAIT
jgi:hypothetical protein